MSSLIVGIQKVAVNEYAVIANVFFSDEDQVQVNVVIDAKFDRKTLSLQCNYCKESIKGVDHFKEVFGTEDINILCLEKVKKENLDRPILEAERNPINLTSHFVSVNDVIDMISDDVVDKVNENSAPPQSPSKKTQLSSPGTK